MKKHTISRVIAIIFMLNIYGYRVQAMSNISLDSTIQTDKLDTKSMIMSNFQNNRDKKNFKEGEILIKVKAGTNEISIQSVEKKYSIKSKKHLNKQLDIVNFDNKKFTMDEMLINLNNDFNIEYAEPNYINTVSSSPDTEPDFSKMWGLYNTTNQGIDINAKPAWNISTGNPNIVVGVIDTGIDYNHEDLKDNIWVNSGEIPYDGIDNDKNGYTDDYNGWNFEDRSYNTYDDNSHGTHVSGTIAALSNGLGTVALRQLLK